MRQRLHLAAALLGEPRILILDEPANGLDPQGMRWLRELLRGLADEGRTVLVSSHVLAEVAQTADDVVVIARGRLVDQGPVERLTGSGRHTVVVRAARVQELAAALTAAGAQVEPDDGGALRVTGLGAPIVGEVALRVGVPLHALYEERRSLEEVFLALTAPEQAAGATRATARHPMPRGGRMTGLLRGELIKLRTTRTAIGFGLLTLALLALPVLAQTLLGRADQRRRPARCGHRALADPGAADPVRRRRRDRRAPPRHASRRCSWSRPAGCGRPSPSSSPTPRQARSAGC